MGTRENQPAARRWLGRRRVGVLLAALLLAGLLAFALSRLGLHRIGHALVTAKPGWVALAFVLMGSSLVLRSISWLAVLHAALPETRLRFAAVTRALMIGVMGSAVVPGRVGEAARVVVITRHLEGSTRRQLPVVAGTVFSQTLINLLALGILAGVTFSSVTLLRGNPAGIATAILIPLLIVALVIGGPRLLERASRSRFERVARVSGLLAGLLVLARRGLVVFAQPRCGIPAVIAQLAAWALQWLACYMVLLALGLQHKAGLSAAAAVLLAVNVSAILPATPSNVGVFQAACLVVLAAYGIGAGRGLAYGIILQAVEVLTALALGIPALLGEGLTWRDIRAESEAGAGAAQGSGEPVTSSASAELEIAELDGAQEASAGDRAQ